jgi:hypothetical protein
MVKMVVTCVMYGEINKELLISSKCKLEFNICYYFVCLFVVIQ